MHEIRFHGRGGQGAKTAAQLLAEAALNEGRQVQAFPEYGPERTGAPVRVYARISKTPIKSYAPVTNPDIVIVIDSTLLKTVDVTEGLSKDSILIINTTKPPEEMKEITKFNGRIFTFDATSLSLKYLNRDIPNTPMLGAVVKLTKIIKLKTLTKMISLHFLKKLGAQNTQLNIKMVEEAYKSA